MNAKATLILEFGATAKLLSQQLLDQGVKPGHMPKEIIQQIDGCQAAIALLSRNVLLTKEEHATICNKLGAKIVKFFEAQTDKINKARNN